MRRFYLLITLIVLMNWSVVPIHAQNTEDMSTLMQFLHYVPDLPDYNSAVGFGDVEAWKRSWNMPSISSYADIQGLDKYQRAYWSTILSRQTFPPPLLNYLQDGNIQRSVGFDLHNIKQFISAGGQAGFIVAEHSSSTDEVATVLQSTGYTSQNTNTGKLYSLGNLLTGFNNILLMGSNRVLMARELDVIGIVNATQRNKILPLSANLNYQALVEALDTKAFSDLGEVTGVLFLDGKLLSELGPYLAIRPGTLPSRYPEEINRIMSEMPPLPPYDLAALVTIHGAGFSYQMVMLVFPTGVNAEPAAKSVELRLQQFKSRWSPKKYVLDYGLEDFGAMSVESQGKSIAVVMLRVPDPPLEFPAGALNSPKDVPARVPNWYDLVKTQELGFLAVFGSGTGAPL